MCQVTELLTNIVCTTCGLMSDSHVAWAEHVAEVRQQEDADHASLLASEVTSSGDQVRQAQRIHSTRAIQYKFCG